jgi:hypothetical protein
MATPNVEISQLALSDVNTELLYPAGTARALNDQVVRILTGNSASSADRAPVAFSALSNKSAFAGLVGNNVSNTGYGTVGATVNFTANSDLYSPTVIWTWIVQSQTPGSTTVFAGDGRSSTQSNGVMVFEDDSKRASFALISNGVGTAVCNVYVNVDVYAGDIDQHFVGSANGYFNLSSTVVAPALAVSGNNTVIANGFSAQTATTIISATSNVASGVIRFTTVPANQGVISGNTITFSTSAISPNSNSNFACQLTTEVLLNGAVLQANVRNISLSANFLTTELTVTGPTSNNQFANNGVTSSIRLDGTHFTPGANVEWVATKVSGDTATFSVAANNAFANLYLTFGSGTYGTAKSIYDIVATMKYANGMVLSQKTNRVTLRAGSYGLNFSPPAASVNASGYAAQTASTSAGATYRAGTFTWTKNTISGVVPVTSNTISGNSATLNISVSANGIGTASNTVYEVGPVLTFDGIVMTPNLAVQTALSSQFLSYTYLVNTSADANTALGSGTQTAWLGLQGSHTVLGGTITWSRNDTGVAIVSNTTYANVSVVAASGQTNDHIVVVTGTLKDATDRVVTNISKTLRLSAFSPNVTFTGPSSNSLTGYTSPVYANAIITASCANGANAFSVSTIKVSGDDLTIIPYAGNTTYDQVTISAVEANIATVAGTYQVTALVTYYDVFYQSTFTTECAAARVSPNFQISAFSTGAGEFYPVANVAGLTVTHDVPNGEVRYSYVLDSSTNGSGTITANVSDPWVDQLVIDVVADSS